MFSSYILSSMAMSFSSWTWCPSSIDWMFSTLVSALSYLLFSAAIWLDFFLKKPNRPFSSSSASKFFSSPIRSVIISPTSPRSFVETLARAASEKSPIFFWQAEPYCSTCWLLVISIFCAKLSTIACSSGLRRTACGSGATSFWGWGAARSSAGSRVSVGVAGASRSKFRVLLSAILIPSFLL